MKLNKVIFSLLVFLLLPSNLYAAEKAEKMVVKDIEFLSGTTVAEELPKYINLNKDDEIRFFVTSDNKLELIDKKNNQTYTLSENIHNPIAIYSIILSKPKLNFYAILDRDIKNNNKTNFFTLIGFSTTDNSYIEHINLDKLKELGWDSTLMNIRRLKNSLIIEGLNKENGKAQYKTQQFVLRWDNEINSFNIENLNKVRAEISATKQLALEDFKLGEVKLEDTISQSIAKYGQPTSTEEYQTVKDETLLRNTYKKDKLFFYHFKDDDNIVSIHTTNKEIATTRGVKVGMKKDDMTDKYGYNHKIRYLTNLTLYSYYLEENSDLQHITFYIHPDDTILGISLDKSDIEIKKTEDEEKDDDKEKKDTKKAEE